MADQTTSSSTTGSGWRLLKSTSPPRRSTRTNGNNQQPHVKTMHLCTRESVRNTTLDNPKKPKTVVLAPGPCRVWLRVTDRMGSRTGPFYLPYAFTASIWNLIILEVPRSFGHEDPSNCRFVSGTLPAILPLRCVRQVSYPLDTTSRANWRFYYLILPVPMLSSDTPPTWPYSSSSLGGR